MLAAEFDAATKMLMCGDHPTALVIGIAQSAQGTRFSFDRARIAGELQCKLVLLEAAIDFAHREVQIAAQIVDLRQVIGATMYGRNRFRFVQRRERIVETIQDAHAFRLADPGRRSLHVVCGGLKGFFECLDRLLVLTRFTQDIAVEASERVARRHIISDCQAPFRQLSSPLVVKLGNLDLRSFEISLTGRRIFGTIQMFGAKTRILAEIPVGSSPVQILATCAEQR